MATTIRTLAQDDPILALFAAVIRQALRDACKGSATQREDARRFLSEVQRDLGNPKVTFLQEQQSNETRRI
jgi:hypothetical protein